MLRLTQVSGNFCIILITSTYSETHFCGKYHLQKSLRLLCLGTAFWQIIRILFNLKFTKINAIKFQTTSRKIDMVLEHLGQDPRIPILKYEPNLVPRVLFLRLCLAWAGKTLGLSCVCVQGRDARNSYAISFHSHGKVVPQLLFFVRPGRRWADFNLSYQGHS